MTKLPFLRLLSFSSPPARLSTLPILRPVPPSPVYADRSASSDFRDPKRDEKENENGSSHGANNKSDILGPLVVMASIISWASWYIIQAEVNKKFAAPYTSIMLMNFMGIFECAFISICADHKKNEWSLRSPIRLVAAFYANKNQDISVSFLNKRKKRKRKNNKNQEFCRVMGSETFLEVILAILLPSVVVFLRYGCGVSKLSTLISSL